MTTDPVQAVLDRLDEVKTQSDGQWMARCPSHDDRKPSLSVGVGDDGRALLRCQAGCALDDVLAAMNPPMTKADLFINPNGSATKRPSQREIVATYDYVDTFGVLLFQVVRYSDKSFLQRRPDENGGWVWDIKGVERCLYRLPELTRAPDHAMIYICEGEKDVDRLIAEGMFATCNSGGAGKWKFTDDTPLHKCQIAFTPDNDESGRDHAQDAVARLHGKAASVRIVELPGLPEHGDVSDWLDAGNDPEDLDELASQAPVWQPETRAIVHKTEAGSPEPYRAGESMLAVNRMAGTARQLRETGITLAEQVAEWLDRRGPATLEGISFPIPYAAAAIGVGRCHFHKLGQIGRVRRLLRMRNTGRGLTDRAITPLVRLLPNRPEDIPQAIEAASELVKAESSLKGYDKPRPVNVRHTTAAVDEIIGPAPKPTAKVAVRREPPPDADTVAVEGFRRQIAELADAAAIIGDGIPPDVRTIIHALTRHRWSLK